jgi:hypothetical protein
MHCTTSKMMRFIFLIAVVAACSDSSPPSPTSAAPSRPLFAVTPACDNQLSNQIAKEQKALFAGAALTEAQDRFKVIKSGCPATSEQMLSYIQFTIDQYRLGNVKAQSSGTKQDAVVAHWNSLFVYLGQPAPNASASVLSADGAAAVMPQAGGTRDLTAGPGPNGPGAGLHVPDNAAPGGSHLYTIQLISSGCIATTLEQTGSCYQLNSYPHVTTFSPRITVVVCQAGHLEEHLALGHIRGNGSSEVLPRPAGPQFPLLCAEPTSDAGFRRWGPLGRALAAAVSVFTPRPAYAAHGGLGGLSEEMSPFGGVELTFFKATFTADAVGQPPGTPETGSWTTITADPPGSIMVQNALGDLTAKPVALNQSGGNCTVCGGLQLTGTVTTASEVDPNTGVYVVRWTSLEDKPTPKEAPFVIRSTAGLEVARLSYRRLSSTRTLAYNNATLPVSWQQSVAQSFEIVVDLGTKTTSLRIDGVPVAGFENVPFVNAAANNVGTVAAEFSGIDAGIVGWDNITITKVAPAQ